MPSEITFGWTIERDGEEVDITIHALCENAKESGVGCPVMEILNYGDYTLTKEEVKGIEDKGFRLLDAQSQLYQGEA